MQKDDIINKIVFEVSKQYSGSENIVKNILIRELISTTLCRKKLQSWNTTVERIRNISSGLLLPKLFADARKGRWNNIEIQFGKSFVRLEKLRMKLPAMIFVIIWQLSRCEIMFR